MKAIIAAGGSGTRLRPLTFSSNKHLLPVANKPLLLYPIEAIAETGITEVGIVVNQTRPAIESLVGNGSTWGLRVTYINQPEALGLAHVVKISESFLAGEPFVYHLGDNIFTDGIMRPFKRFTSSKPDALLTMVEHEENYRLGVPYFDAQGNLEKVVEKPENPPNKYGVPGLYFFNQNVFKAFRGEDAIQPSARGELEITDLYSYLLRHNYRVEAEEVDGRWMDPGKFDDMLEANAYLLDVRTDYLQAGMVDDTSEISGNVAIGEGTHIVGSRIEGPVAIGKGCVIEDSHIGPHVSVDDNCTLTSVTVSGAIIMQDTTIRNTKRKIINSLIGRNTSVWEEQDESVSLFIGDHCKVRLT